MNIYEFGKRNQPVILLLHGGGLSWWTHREVAALLEDRYHVVLPILDGHAGSDHPFESIEANADRLLVYIDRHFGGHIFALGGLSLGAQIATEMLARRPDLCSRALIESASVIPSHLTNMLIGPTFSSSYPLIQYQWFSKLQFRSLHMNKGLYEDYYRDTCAIRKQDLISFLQANTAYRLPESIQQTKASVCIAVGGKEQAKMKKSAKLLHQAIAGSELFVAEGLYHGELSINHPNEYVELLLR